MTHNAIDWARAGQSAVVVVLVLCFCWWLIRRIEALVITWERIIAEDAEDRLIHADALPPIEADDGEMVA